ncbi:uncharacterized protein LOC132628575 [Lycium barbarum]|uniref:uncharacterized protein LOC132628575 n=1 Tax=Lycium barbarum TaxID=112863 RepID=UPI00293F4480|nr:uncharacterized protein LOC132628575 [Lycium barbarum]
MACTNVAPAMGRFASDCVSMTIYEVGDGHSLTSAFWFRQCKWSGGIDQQDHTPNLKRKLEDAKGSWPANLPEVLWAYRTIAKSSTRETPFSLVNGAETLIPVEVGTPSLWYLQAIEWDNSDTMLVQLNLLEEH